MKLGLVTRIGRTFTYQQELFNESYHFFRQGMDSHILRFYAKMLSKIEENTTRDFIICYYLSDDTISVFEIAKRNSGKVTLPI